MEHLYNTIKPVGKRVIVAIRSGDKDSHKIVKDDGTEVELFVDTSYSWDGKISNQTQGRLLTDYKNLKAGTYVLLHHNAVTDENKLDIKPDIHTSVHSIEDMFVYFGVDGDEVLCIDGYMLAERIYDEQVSPGGIILSEPQKRESLLKIMAKPKSITDFEVGEIAVVYKYSDYEMTHNVGGKQRKLIRLKYSDCLGKWED